MSLDEAWGAEAEPAGGTSLRELIAGKPVEQRRALLITRQVLEALATVHATGAIHGDVRPESITVTSGLGKDDVKLGGGGAAPKAGVGKGGDPVYRAPEAALGAVDARSDVYSVGAVLFELLTGRPPFFADEPDALRRLHAYAPIQPLKQRAPGVAFAETLETIVATALAKKRDSRFASAADMIAALDRALTEIEAAMPPPVASEQADGPNDSLKLLAQDLMPQAQRAEPSAPIVPLNVGREVPELPWQARASQTVRRRLDRASSRVGVSRQMLVGGLAVAGIVALVTAMVMCSGSEPTKKAPAAVAEHVGSAKSKAVHATPKSLHARCAQLGKACGDGAKRVAKIVDECTKAADGPVGRSCAAAAMAAYDCYESKLCGKSDPVWALDDLRVLSARKSQCVAESDALRACGDKTGH